MSLVVLGGGSPDKFEMISRKFDVGAYVDLGMDGIALDMHLGIPHRDVMASMERFAAKVMPRFKDEPRLVGAG